MANASQFSILRTERNVSHGSMAIVVHLHRFVRASQGHGAKTSWWMQMWCTRSQHTYDTLVMTQNNDNDIENDERWRQRLNQLFFASFIRTVNESISFNWTIIALMRQRPTWMGHLIDAALILHWLGCRDARCVMANRDWEKVNRSHRACLARITFVLCRATIEIKKTRHNASRNQRQN